MQTKRNYANIARQVIDPEEDRQNLRQFMSDSPWEAQAIIQKVQQEFDTGFFAMEIIPMLVLVAKPPVDAELHLGVDLEPINRAGEDNRIRLCNFRKNGCISFWMIDCPVSKQMSQLSQGWIFNQWRSMFLLFTPTD